MNVQKNWAKNWKETNTTNKLTMVLFVIYLMALGWIVLLKLGVRFSYMENRQINLIPFRESLLFKGNMDYGEIIMNVLIFVPLGIYAGILFKRWTFGKGMFFFFFTSLCMEGLQYILRIGAFDVTDIITNTTGGMIGLMMYKIIEKVFNNSLKIQKSLNAIATLGTVLMILFLVLLKTNSLGIRYQ